MKNIKNIELELIIPDENQPRKYFNIDKINILKNSIKKYGIINPLTVEKDNKKYRIIDGERRYRASVELGLKEIPCIVQDINNRAERLIQQFHIQEQREGWTPTEKAIAMRDIAKELNVPFSELGEVLGIPSSTLNSYRQFISLIEFKYFQKSELSIDWTKKIKGLTNCIKKIYILSDTSLSKEEESKIERLCIDGIKKQILINSGSFAKLKDIFRTNPNLIEVFIKEKKSIQDLFKTSNLDGIYALRNVMNNIKYISTHTDNFLIYKKDISLSDSEKNTIELAISKLKKLI